MKELDGKKILMLSPSFFGYENEIKKELQKQGAEVFLYDERVENDFCTKLFVRLNFKLLIKNKIDNYYENIIEQTKNIKLHYLFLIVPETIDIEIILKLKTIHGDIQLYVYMWDSIKNKKNGFALLSAADKFFTFDPSDSKIDSKIEFLPLFYIEDYKNIAAKENYNYDISFVGTIHSDRYQIVKRIEAAKIKIFYYFFSPSKMLFKLQQLLHKNFRNIESKDIFFKSLKKEHLLKIIASSRAVMDIEHPNQKGLTMRTIEMLGAKKKLVTTNSNIIEYDFYRAENICIIDRKNPKVEQSFLKDDYKELPAEIYEKYSLKNWVLKIFR